MPKILIVEDEEVLRESYRIILSTEPYDIMTAQDGGQALKLCISTVYDLVLLDLMMPRVSGVEFLEKFKHLDIQMPKVIILSNLSSGDDLTRALSLGAHGNIVKADMSPRQLISLVRHELQTADS